MEDKSLHLYEFLSNVVGSEDVIKTRRRLFSAQNVLLSSKDMMFLSSGSKAEGLDMTGSDYDVMLMDMNYRVLEFPSVNNSDTFPVCIMDCHDTKLGFTRLRVNPGFKLIIDYFLQFLIVVEDVVYLSRLRWQQNQLERSSNKNDWMIHGPCVSTKNETFEYLHCLRCYEWITAAQPWISRARGHWPRCEVIDRITDFGVLFVPVGCKNSPNEHIEWRISFSLAEKELVHSFTHTQMLCYAALKLILSDIVKPKHGELLCSYFLKTIMLWLAEEIDQTKWIPSNFVWCFGQCLKRLLYCVTYSSCVHYFIPEINFFDDRFTESEHKQLLITLTEINNTGVNIIMQTATNKRYNLETLIRGPICSSFLSVYAISKMSVYGTFSENANIENVIERSMHFQSNTLLLLLASIFCYSVNIDIKSSNKSFFKQYKKYQTGCLIGLSSDAVTGWCRLASLFYKCKQYTTCQSVIHNSLFKCTPDKMLLSVDPYITSQLSEMIPRKYFTKAVKHTVFDSIIFNSDNILPEELVVFYRKSKKRRLMVPPVVYLHFLDSLCAYHQGNYMDIMKSVRCLELVINERYLMSPDQNQMNITQYCLRVAQSLLH